MAKSNEPIFWSLFSAGGMVAALFLPILMVITGFVVPNGFAPLDTLSYERVHSAISGSNIVKLVLFGVIALPFFHWAHRFKFTLVDIGLRKISLLLSVLCYGGAISATVVTAIILWQI
ncbi:MAG: fumarate reductase subunit D [Acidobacteria bacterium]|nr:fumarate reductase subunit D [Acidobacteriota bacterium]|tara:strand:+ start:3296 stop:3649 length:354 start_codon:yes stop_codon:yes gene_type:complete